LIRPLECSCKKKDKKLENIATITAGQYKQALETYPLLSTLYSLVKEFHAAVFSKKPRKLDTWIESARKHDIPELQSFVEGILKDSTAIKNELWKEPIYRLHSNSQRAGVILYLTALIFGTYHIRNNPPCYSHVNCIYYEAEQPIKIYLKI